MRMLIALLLSLLSLAGVLLLSPDLRHVAAGVLLESGPQSGASADEGPLATPAGMVPTRTTSSAQLHGAERLTAAPRPTPTPVTRKNAPEQPAARDAIDE